MGRWPQCSLCQRSVDSYGVVDENAKYVDVEATCRGAYDVGIVVHPPRRGVQRVKKWSGMKLEDMGTAISLLRFFSPIHLVEEEKR